MADYIFKPNDIELQVVQDIVDRQKRGLNKYGVSVTNNPLSLREWLAHQYEELLDAAIYCRRAMAEIDKQQDDLKQPWPIEKGLVI